MSPAVWVLWRWASLAVLCAAGAVLLRELYSHPRTGLRSRWSAHVERLERRTAFLRAAVTGRQLALAQVATLVLALLLTCLVHGALGALLFPLVFLVDPWLNARVDARLTTLDAQLEGWLLALSGALDTSASLGQALQETAGSVPSPLRDELTQTTREIGLGVSVADALTRMAKRVGSPTLSTAIAAIRIGQRTGGGLAATLARAAETLREMARLEGVVRTRTAEGRAQASVVALIPAPMVGLLHWLQPTLMAPLWQRREGLWVVAGAVVLWVSSFLLARRILDVDI